MKWNNIKITIFKELRGIVRDKKSFHKILLYPIIIPVIILLFGYLFDYMDNSSYSVGINYKLSDTEKSIVEEIGSINYNYYKTLDDMELAYKNGEITGYIVKDDKNYIVYTDPSTNSGQMTSSYINSYLDSYNQLLGYSYLTGDIIQSTYTNVQPKYQNEYAQLEHFVRDVPYHPSIRYIVVFGNHDFNTFSKNEEFMEIFLSRKDFYLLGVEFGFINWRGATICLFHPVKRNPLKKPHYENITMTFRGHSHQLRYRGSSTTYVPALCDDPVNRDTVVPGFLVSTNNDNYLSVDSYYFKDSLHYGGRVQHKKL